MLTAKKETFRGWENIALERAPQCIAKLFTGSAFPVIYKGEMYLAKYERDIDDLYILRQISKAEIYRKASEYAQKIYEMKACEATKIVAVELQEIMNELDKITPPWE